MLAFDRPTQPRSRRPGQHARNADDQACVDALAAFLRYDAAGADHCLGRLARTVLAGRLLPAAMALAEAVSAVLTRDSPSGSTPVTIDYTASPACLAGECAGQADRPVCESIACEHYCHSDQGRSGRDGAPAP